jgi:hypothetical protein
MLFLNVVKNEIKEEKKEGKKPVGLTFRCVCIGVCDVKVLVCVAQALSYISESSYLNSLNIEITLRCYLHSE